MATSKIPNTNQTPEQYLLINSTYRTGQIVFTRQGSLVVFNSGNDFKTLSQSTWIVLGTVPERFRPVNDIQVRVSNNANLIRIQIKTDGEVSAYNNGPAITTNTNGAFNGAYAVA